MSEIKKHLPALVAGSANQKVVGPTPIEQFNILFTRPSLCPSLNAISDINRRRNTYANDFILGIVERIYILELARGKSMPSDFLWKIVTMSQKKQRFCVAYPFRACADCGKKCALCSQPLIEIRNRWRESGWTLKELNWVLAAAVDYCEDYDEYFDGVSEQEYDTSDMERLLDFRQRLSKADWAKMEIDYAPYLQHGYSFD